MTRNRNFIVALEEPAARVLRRDSYVEDSNLWIVEGPLAKSVPRAEYVADWVVVEFAAPVAEMDDGCDAGRRSSPSAFLSFLKVGCDFARGPPSFLDSVVCAGAVNPSVSSPPSLLMLPACSFETGSSSTLLSVGKVWIRGF